MNAIHTLRICIIVRKKLFHSVLPGFIWSIKIQQLRVIGQRHVITTWFCHFFWMWLLYEDQSNPSSEVQLPMMGESYKIRARQQFFAFFTVQRASADLILIKENNKSNIFIMHSPWYLTNIIPLNNLIIKMIIKIFTVTLVHSRTSGI